VTRLRLWLIARIRASRFLPVGMADKRADVERLNKPFAGSVMLFFPNGADALYQLRPWFGALKALAAGHGLTAVFKDSRTAAIVRDESGLDCVTLANYGQLDQILAVSEVKLALYVNHDPVNFEVLRFTSLVHVYLGHGDSDKGVSVSNQVKAYDFCFLAGQAALDRTSAAVMLYDAAERSVLVGQPSLDVPAPTPSPDPNRQTVLYAPTWESSQPSVSYGSVITHGSQVLAALTGNYRVIYRPHPLNGIIDPAYAAADAALRASADRIDTDVPLAQSFADADLLITDVSAVTLNWLPTAKPVLVCLPRVPIPPSKLMSALPLLEVDADIAAEVATSLADDPTKAARVDLIDYYLGDTSPGVATERFLTACADTINLRDRLWAEKQGQGATGP